MYVKEPRDGKLSGLDPKVPERRVKGQGGDHKHQKY